MSVVWSVRGGASLGRTGMSVPPWGHGVMSGMDAGMCPACAGIRIHCCNGSRHVFKRVVSTEDGVVLLLDGVIGCCCCCDNRLSHQHQHLLDGHTCWFWTSGTDQGQPTHRWRMVILLSSAARVVARLHVFNNKSTHITRKYKTSKLSQRVEKQHGHHGDGDEHWNQRHHIQPSISHPVGQHICKIIGLVLGVSTHGWQRHLTLLGVLGDCHGGRCASGCTHCGFCTYSFSTHNPNPKHTCFFQEWPVGHFPMQLHQCNTIPWNFALTNFHKCCCHLITRDQALLCE